MLKVIRYPFAVLCLVLVTAFTPASEHQGITVPKISFANTTLFARLYNERFSTATAIAAMYDEWRLSNVGISKRLFTYAAKGYSRLLRQHKLENSAVLTIADLSKPSVEKRLYVIDMQTGELLFRTWVAHGKNSGEQYARYFSNEESSYATSLGFYTTAGTYEGKHGYSLKLSGCEKGFNDNADKRCIVLHGADYVGKAFIAAHGYLGRSQGCPAVADEISTPIIDVIKNGSCFFVYAPEKKYLKHSALLKG